MIVHRASAATTCLACGSAAFDEDRAQSKIFGTNFPLHQCTDCESYFLGRPLAPDDLYGNEYWEKFHRGRKHSWLFERYDEACHRLIARSQWKYMEERAPWNLKGRRLLDIGCGRGDTLRYLDARGVACDGLEPDESYARALSDRLRHGECHVGTVESATLEGRYDIVSASHVLEHAGDPLTFLRGAGFHLTAEGFLYIEVPNCENPQVLRDSIDEHPHTVHFTSTGLRRLLERAGFMIRDLAYYRQLNAPRERNRLRKWSRLPSVLLAGDYCVRSDDAVAAEHLRAWGTLIPETAEDGH